MGRTLTTLTCDGCNKQFTKVAAEIKRQLKKNPDRKFYCHMSCYGRTAGKVNLGEDLGKGNASVLNPRNRQDEFSPFRYFMNKARNRKYATDLNLVFLRDLWEEQQGICPLSGLDMNLPVNSLAWQRDTGNPWKPSLDRIDSSKGYLRGNVRYILSMANFCKQSWSDEDVIKFCRAVAAHQS